MPGSRKIGHMQGVNDEYAEAMHDPYNTDYNSIMNEGEEIKPRHYKYFQEWIDDKLSQ